jgi:hypothetical protein
MFAGADPEERNSNGLTAFHVAIQTGSISAASFFFDNYPPKDIDFEAIYSIEGMNILSIAVKSCEPEIVWMVLENLAKPSDIQQAWSWATSNEGRNAIRRSADGVELGKFEDILKLLSRYGDFTPPPTPAVSRRGIQASETTSSNGSQKSRAASASSSKNTSSSASTKDTPLTPMKGAQGRGRGRGRSRGKGRGGAGRGRGYYAKGTS